MRTDSITNQRWHRNPFYPALTREQSQRLHAQLAIKDRKISTLSATCEDLARQNYEQEQRIIELEQRLKHANRLQESYEELIVAKAGYRVPEVAETPEPFST